MGKSKNNRVAVDGTSKSELGSKVCQRTITKQKLNDADGYFVREGEMLSVQPDTHAFHIPRSCKPFPSRITYNRGVSNSERISGGGSQTWTEGGKEDAQDTIIS